MRKKNLFKKLIATAGAMVMALTMMMPLGVSAASTIDSKNVNLVIEKRIGSNTDLDETVTGEYNTSVTGEYLKGVEFTVVKVAEIDSADTNEGIAYKLTANGASLTLLGSEGNKVTGTALQNWVSDKSSGDFSTIKTLSGAVSGETDGNKAQVVFSSNNTRPSNAAADSTLVNLTTGQGLYLVVETGSPAEVTSRSHPFLVSLPMTDKNDLNTWNYDVYAYPKNSTADTSVDKTITAVTGEGSEIATGNTSAQANIGDTITYQVPITAVIPEGGLEKLGIRDTMDQGLTLVTAGTSVAASDIVVYEGNGTSGNKVDPTNYTVTATKGENNSTVLEVMFTGKYIGTLNNNASTAPDPSFTFVYKATLNANAVVGSTGNGNAAQLVYNYKNNPAGTSEDGDVESPEKETTVYTWGIQITKNDETNNALENVEFQLRRDSSTGDVITFAKGSGIYTPAVGGSASATLTTDSSGLITIKGLASGTYYLEETKTLTGYTLLKDMVKIVITGDEANGSMSAEVNGSAATVVTEGTSPTALATLTVVNNKGFDLPQTGAAGTALFAIVGIVLAAVAGGLLFFLKRSPKRR